MTSEPDATKLKRIKRYDIIRLIGEGGMGRVYLANDKIIRRPVAIKVFTIMSTPGSETTKEKLMRDFFLETQTAGALLHPNIVVIYDVGKKGDLFYMVMEFVYGRTVLEHQRTSPFSMKKSVEIIYELALALDYAHSKGVVHRDIKPENIIMSAQGIPKITDFGIARFRKHLKGHRRHAVVGSSRFMAPEQVLRREQDHRVDIYQLGVVLFELLTRQSPFKGIDSESTLSKICTEVPPPPGRINPEIPEQLDRIVSKCLEKNPNKRYPRAKDLADDLAACLKAGIHTLISPDDELVENLKKFELFSLFSEEEISELVKVGEFVTCHAGQYIIRENETDSNFFVLLEGNVKVVKQSRILTGFLPGAVFGEVGAFARQQRSAGVVAQGDCKLLQINALLFKELDPLLQLKMLHIVLRNIASLVISLDGELMQLTDGKGRSAALPLVCPLCGFNNKAPIEICPRCGVIPAKYPEPLMVKEKIVTKTISDDEETQEYLPLDLP
ncbi:serine/threonine-protein kinase [Desulfomonile tiedjei]|uniref:Serine/threonine protein kinase n=1 Tax=Desulfomonile tiedjei (strain ATCC 49306 / DSM 6799 / DCB-1) TaxID=706587 RepID=I4CAA5_DESTA|nr:serine/threonine-protein kinase [Desulfomonile tiedjei]AFM26496.1 serine/threonine protein kinase [Desulfomonile tiedjei DSM 6799]